MTTVDRLVVAVRGRPAPQGSKRSGQYGQLREQSNYLPAWRAAVRLAVYERYRALDVLASQLPLFRGPVAVSCVFWLDTGDRIDGPPDFDKLLRSTWDALTAARVWEDDSRVVRLFEPLAKLHGPDTGADIIVRPLAELEYATPRRHREGS